MRSLKTRSATLLGLLILVLGTGMAFAQDVTGALKGQITDQDGAVLPGATVAISSPNLLGGPKVASTDDQGKYRFVNLDPGLYEVKFTMDGFADETRVAQRIQVGGVTTIDVTLKVAEATDNIVVTGQTPVVDREKSGVSHNITKELMTEIPIGRNYQDIIAMLPGVKGSGNANVHGESGSSNKFLVDGVDTTDPTTGTFGTNFVFEAIQDVQYSTAGYMPEHGQVMGAVTNLVTKSGGNEIHGGVVFDTFQPSFQSTHDEEIKQEKINKSTTYETSGQVGGPVKKDKVWYFGAFEMYDRKTKQDLVAFDNTVRVYYWLGKLSSQLNQNNRLVFQAHGDPFDMKGENLSTAWTEETRILRLQGGEKVSGDHTWILSPNAFLQTRAYYNRQVLDINGLSDEVGVQDVDASIRNPTTNEPYNFVNYANQGSVFASSKNMNRRYRKQFESTYSHLLESFGDHEIKAGLEVEYASEKATSGGAWKQMAETWVRSGFLDRWQPAGAVWDGTFNYSQYSHPDGSVSDGRQRISAFVQDKWTYKRATLNYGFRVDDTIAENDVKQDILNFTTFSPRFGMSYDLLGNGRTVLRGSAGRYYENPKLLFPGSFNQGSKPSYRHMYNWKTQDFDILRSIWGGPSGYVIYQDQILKSPFKDEFTIGGEHELIPDFSIGVDYVHGRTKDVLEDIELNQIWEQYTDDVWAAQGIPSVPNWRITGYVDGTPQVIFALTNPPEARRQYDGIELTLNKRFSNKWQLFGSYTWSKAKGTVEDSFTAFADSPVDYYNRNGFLSHDRTHDIVISASYHMPWGIRLGTRTTFQSGAPFTFTYRDGEDSMNVWLTTRGGTAPFAFDVTDSNGKVWRHYDKGQALRMPWTKGIALRAEKTFKISQGEIGAVVDMTNIFNWSDLNGFTADVENIAVGPSFQGPRRMEFLARYTF